MTINGIWEWAGRSAEKVPMEALRGKTLTIDGHIWLYESVKGCEAHHQTHKNTYLVTFFKRIQRLKELQITPIVVFDHISTKTKQSSFAGSFVARKRRVFVDSHFTNLADHVYNVQCLVKSLGVRVIIAPGDGEAQCALLEQRGFSAGCITSDFDYFLFGGKNLYRFEFGTSSTVARVTGVSHLAMGKMWLEKRLTRQQLIAAAILLGCDYYEKGVSGIGIARVFEVLAEFGENDVDDCVPPDALVILDRFYAYATHETPERPGDSLLKLHIRRRGYQFPVGFPSSDDVINAVRMYQKPEVYDGESSVPLVVEMRKAEEILVKLCGWTPERMNKEVTTSRKRAQNLTNSVTQTRIPDFFAATKKKRVSPITEPCSSLDDYISAQTKWVDKRNQSSATSRSSRIDRNKSSNENQYKLNEQTDTD